MSEVMVTQDPVSKGVTGCGNVTAGAGFSFKDQDWKEIKEIVWQLDFQKEALKF